MKNDEMILDYDIILNYVHVLITQLKSVWT